MRARRCSASFDWPSRKFVVPVENYGKISESCGKISGPFVEDMPRRLRGTSRPRRSRCTVSRHHLLAMSHPRRSRCTRSPQRWFLRRHRLHRREHQPTIRRAHRTSSRSRPRHRAMDSRPLVRAQVCKHRLGGARLNECTPWRLHSQVPTCYASALHAISVEHRTETGASQPDPCD